MGHCWIQHPVGTGVMAKAHSQVEETPHRRHRRQTGPSAGPECPRLGPGGGDRCLLRCRKASPRPAAAEQAQQSTKTPGPQALPQAGSCALGPGSGVGYLLPRPTGWAAIAAHIGAPADK
jgi:hypothetical protein